MDSPSPLGQQLAPITIDMPETPHTRNRMFRQSPSSVIDADTVYHAVMHTEKGDITIRLLAEAAPVTVNNFVYLSLTGFYAGTMFHRVIADFMAQGGDPSGTGTGGPGYQFQDEFDPAVVFDRPGLLAMANAGPGTNGSQFFITFVPTAWLNQKHTIFGEVVAGMDVVNRIRVRDPQRDRQPGDLIREIAIFAQPQADTSG